MPVFTLPSGPIVPVPATLPTVPVEIEYRSGVDLIFRERNRNSAWTKRRPDPIRSGSYKIDMRAGDKYEVEAYSRDLIDSMVPGFPEVATGVDRLDVATLRAVKIGASTTFPLTEPFSPEVGGTFWFARVATVPLPTFVTLQIGAEPPTPDGSGFLRINQPKIQMLLDEATVHDIEAQPLLPGNSHFFVLSIFDGASDSQGIWEQKSGSFTTKQRTVSIFFDKLVITDDSDPGDTEKKGAGPGRFAFQIREVGNLKVNAIKDLEFTVDEFTDKSPDNQIDLAPFGLAHVVLPKPLTPETEHLSIALRGIEEDAGWFFDTDDIAETLFGSGKRLELPTGRFKENVPDGTQKIQANPRTSADMFTFHVHVKFSVFYS